MQYEFPLMKDTFHNEFLTKLKLCWFLMTTKKLSMGDTVARAEEAFAKKMKAKYCVMFNSGGSANLALFIAMKNLGLITEDSTVGITALTWSTNLTPALLFTKNIVPFDVYAVQCYNTHVNRKVDILWTTNVLGQVCFPNIEKGCEPGIKIVDSCELTPTTLPGDVYAQTYSSFVGHHMSTVEGGYIVTNDLRLATMLKVVRANGWTRDIGGAKYDFVDIGFNFRPTEITGFLCLEALKTLDKTTKIRRDKVKRGFGYIPFCIPLDLSMAMFKYWTDQKGVIKILEKDGIEARPMIAGNITRTRLWKKYMGDPVELYNTDIIHNKWCYVGLNTSTNIKKLSSKLKKHFIHF